MQQCLSAGFLKLWVGTQSGLWACENIIIPYFFFIWVVGGPFESGEDDPFLIWGSNWKSLRTPCLSGPVFVLGFIKISL
jgi:hypothetical protein